MSSSPWTTTAWDEFHRTGVEPPAPDVPPFRLEGLETRDPRRLGADEGDTVNSRDFEDGATLFPDRTFTKKKHVSRLEDARRAVPKVLAGWNVTFSPSSPGTFVSQASQASATARANRRRGGAGSLLPSIFDGRGSAAATASDGESDATARTADGVRENVFASARRFLSRAVGWGDPARAGSTRVASTTSTAKRRSSCSAGKCTTAN